MHFKQTSKEDEFVQYMTRDSIIRATNRAKRMKLNRVADMKFLKSLHPTLNFPVLLSIDHKGYDGQPDVKRLIVMTNRHPNEQIQVDIPYKYLEKDVFQMKLNTRKDRK